ncbi:MAG: hypothetical protein NWS99_01665 [Paracoccaceae bacterium]|nr:hypothetical protein [Paracoccaceae bacterium]
MVIPSLQAVHKGWQLPQLCGAVKGFRATFLPSVRFGGGCGTLASGQGLRQEGRVHEKGI